MPPLHGSVNSVFRPAYIATRISLVFWSCSLIILIADACIPETSADAIQATISYIFVASLSLVIDVAFLVFLYRTPLRPLIPSGWIAVVIFGVLFISFGFLTAGLEKMNDPSHWQVYLIFLAFIGIFLRDGLVHQSYRKWETSFQSEDDEMARLRRAISNPYNVYLTHPIFNHVAGNQINIGGDHSEQI